MSGAGCHCDTQCYQIGDCCSDYNLQCVHPITTTTPATAVINTCAGRCSSGQSRSLVRAPSSSKCYCDPGCVSVGDCCPDYPQQCQKTTTTTTPTPSGSCVGKCASSLFRLSVRQGEDKMTRIVGRTLIMSFGKGRNVRVTISASSTGTAALTTETRAPPPLPHQQAAVVSVCVAARLKQAEAASVTLAVSRQEIAARITSQLV